MKKNILFAGLAIIIFGFAIAYLARAEGRFGCGNRICLLLKLQTRPITANNNGNNDEPVTNSQTTTFSPAPAQTRPITDPVMTPGASAATDPSANSTVVTFTGLVMAKDSANSFTISDGAKSYTVILDNLTSSNTKVINLRGKIVGNTFIQTGNFVTVTGTVSGSTISARIIQVQTVKDEGA